MFADDGFQMSNEYFKPIPPPGHEFHGDKSRWVKREIKGETFILHRTEVVKFLGVEIDFENDRMSGHTRKGNKLTFSLQADNLVELIGSLAIESYPFDKSKLENISSSGL